MNRIIAGLLVVSLATAVALYAQDPLKDKKRVTGRPAEAPVLLAPENGSQVTDPFPVFQWRPISVPPGIKLTYTLTIVEREPSQSLQDAFDNNYTFHEGSVDGIGVYKYPTTGSAFEKNKEYAFRVSTYVAEGIYPSAEDAKSAIWSFRFAGERKGPRLIAPSNASSLSDFYPVFQWRPIDAPPGVKLSYTLAIVEREPGQSPQQAIDNNYTFHEGTVDAIGVYKYPKNGRAFQKDKEYAFQVSTYVEEGIYPAAQDAKSEVWSFRFTIEKKGPVVLSPVNGSKVTDANPVFQWKAVEAIPGVQLRYTLAIAEVDSSHSPNEAMESSSLTHEAEIVNSLSYKYPATAYPLESGKQYAVRITSHVREGVYPVADDASSEVVSFFFGSPAIAYRPPHLIAPSNGSAVTNPNPVFQWNVVDAPPEKHIDYDLLIVELRKGQKPLEALKANETFHQVVIHDSGKYAYPAEGLPFEKGKEYVFQITASPEDQTLKLANDGRSETWTFAYKGESVSSFNLPFKSIALVADVAELVNLNNLVVTDEPNSLRLNGSAGLRLLVPDASQEIIPVNIDNLTLTKGDYTSPRFTAGRISGTLRPGDLPQSMIGNNLVAGTIEFACPASLTVTAQLKLLDAGKLLPLDGTLKLTRTGLSGELTCKGSVESPLATLGTGDVKFKITEAAIRFSQPIVTLGGVFELYGNRSSCTVKDLTLASDGTISGSLDCTIPLSIALVPQSDKLMLNISRVNGDFEAKLKPDTLTYDFQIHGAVDLKADEKNYFGADVVLGVRPAGISVRSFTPRGDVNLSSIDLGWLKLLLSRFSLSSLSFSGGKWDFAFDMDMSFFFPLFDSLQLPTIRGITFGPGGFKFPTIDLPQLNLPNVDFSGFGLSFESLRLPSFTFPWPQWKLGSPTGFNFDLGLNLTMPNLPSLTPISLRGLNIHIPHASLGDLGFNATLPSFKFDPPGIKLPMLGGLSFDISDLFGSLGANFKGSLFDLLPDLRIAGRLQLPDLFECPGSERYLDLLSPGVRMNGFGGLSGKIDNIVPKCPLVLGPFTLSMQKSSLDFKVSQKTQSIIIDGTGQLLFKSQSGKSVSTSVMVTYDISQGTLIALKGSLDTPFVWDVPPTNPVLSFSLDKATIDLETILIDGRQTLRLDGGHSISCTFNKLAIKWSDFSVASGEVIFDNAFALMASVTNSSLMYKAVKRDTVLTAATGFLLQLPQTLTLNRSGLTVSGSGTANLRLDGRDLASVEARFSTDCAFRLSPFGLSTGQIEFFYDGSRVAILNPQGFFPDAISLVAKVLPDTIPLPVASVAFAIIKSNGQELITHTSDSTGLRLQTKAGQPIRLVIPALQYNKPVPPEVDITLNIVVNPLTLALVSGTIEAMIPPTKAADFDLSPDGIPFVIQKLTYQKASGLDVYKFDGQLNLFGKAVKGENALQLTLMPDGRLSGTMSFSTKESIPVSTGSDRVDVVINQVDGSIASQATPGQIAFDINLASTVRLKLSETRFYGATTTIHFTQDGFELKNFKADSASDAAVFDLKWVQFGLSDLTIPKFSYQRTTGWDYEFGVSIQLVFPDLTVKIPKVAGIIIDKQGIHFPAISIPEMSDSVHLYTGFGLRPLAFRMAPFLYNWYTGAAGSSGGWGFAFDFELSFPQFPAGAAGALRTPKVSILNARYSEGKITAMIEAKDFAAPGVLLPLAGEVGLFVRNISGDLTVNGGVQNFNVLFKGNLSLPKSFQCGTDDGLYDLLGTTLSVTARGGVSGSVANFVPRCPLDMGIGKLQVTTSTLTFAFTNSAQSALLDLTGTLKIPGQTSTDTISATGSIKYDLVRNAMIDGAIAITQPFTWKVPSEDPVLIFVLRGAVLNKDGLLINGQSDLRLAGGGLVVVSMNNLLIDVRTFAVKSGDAAFRDQIALKLVVDNGNLNWSVVSPTTTLTERYAALLALPSTLKLDVSGLSVSGESRVAFRWNDTTWSNLLSRYSSDFCIRLSPFRVKSGKADIFRDTTLAARVDSTGIQPGNLLGVVPLPDRIPLPGEQIAYLEIKQNGVVMVETQPVPSGMQLRTGPGRKVKLIIPALQYGKPAPPFVEVALDVTVNTSTYQIMGGSIAVSGDSLLALRDAGIPIILTSLSYERGQGGSYGITVSGFLDLPKVLADLRINVDNLTLSSSGLSGSVTSGVFSADHRQNETYIGQKRISDLELKIQGVEAVFGAQQREVKFSGDVVSNVFKDGTNPAPIHYAAVFDAGKKAFVFTLSFVHLEDGAIPISVARFKPMAVKTNPAAEVTASGDEFAITLSGILTAPSLSQTFSLTFGGLKVSTKSGISVASISYTQGEEQHFNLFGADFVINSLAPSYANSVLYLAMSGSLTFLNNQSTFQNFKIGTDGSISLGGADFISRDVFVVPDYVVLSKVGIRQDSLLVEGFVRLPQPADTSRQRFNFQIAPNGTISGGSEITILNAPAELAGRDFWIAKFHPTYAALSLDLTNLMQSRFKVIADVYLNNDVNKRIEIGYRNGGAVFPGLEVTFGGSVRWGNVRASVSDFDWESLKLSGLTITAPADVPRFSLSMSGLMTVSVPGVTGGINFTNLSIDALENLSLPRIEGGVLSLADIVNLEIKEFGFSSTPRDIYVPRGSAPSGSSAAKADSEKVSVSSYIRFGATIDVAGVGRGGVEEFLLYKTQTSTNLLIRNANFGVVGVADFRVDMKYQSSANGFALLVGGTGTVVNGSGIIVVGKIGRMNNVTSLGLFVAAQGLAMPIPPPVPPAVPVGYLTGIGGGFFLNPDQADLDLVKQLAGFTGKDQQTESKIRDPGRFAALLFGSASLIEPTGTVVKGRVLVTITETYFNVDGRVVLLTMENVLEGSMHLSVRRTPTINANGNITVMATVPALLSFNSGLNFFIYGGNDWGIMGNIDAKVFMFLDMHGKLFIGAPGFIASLSIGQPIELWLINLNAGVELTMWYKASVSWGAYAKSWINVSVLGGAASAQGYLRFALLGGPDFYLYGIAGLHAQAVGLTWDGSVWAKVSASGVDGGFDVDPALERLIADATNTAADMNTAANNAAGIIQNARATPPALTTAELENAFATLYSLTLGLRSSNNVIKVLCVLLLKELEQEFLAYGAPALANESAEFNWVLSNIYAATDAPDVNIRVGLSSSRNNLDASVGSLNSQRAVVATRLAQIAARLSPPTQAGAAAGDENPVSGLASFDPNSTVIPSLTLDTTKVLSNASLFAQAELSKDKTEERISAAITSLESALQDVDRALQGTSGQQGVRQFGSSYADLLEADEKFFADYVSYFASENIFAGQKMILLNAREAALTNVIRAKTERLSPSDRRALGEWRYRTILTFAQTPTPEIDSKVGDWIIAWRNMTEAQQKAELNAKGVALWIEVPRTGLAALMRKATACIDSADHAYMDDHQNLTTSQAAYTRALDSLYQKKTRLTESLYDILDRYSAWKRENVQRVSTRVIRVGGQERAVAVGIAAPAVAAGYSLEQIEAKKAALRQELEVPRITSIRAAVTTEADYVKGKFDWSASSMGGIVDYSMRIDAEGYQNVGDKTSLSRYFFRQSYGNRMFHLRARAGAGYSNERSVGFVVPLIMGQSIGAPATASSPVVTAMTTDNTAPPAPSVHLSTYKKSPTNNLAVSSNRTQIECGFSAYDQESGITEYQYAVGSNQYSTDLQGWQSASGRTDIVITQLALGHGQRYYVLVKARNGANLWSSAGASEPLLIDTTRPTPPQKLLGGRPGLMPLPPQPVPTPSPQIGSVTIIPPIPLPAAVLQGSGGSGGISGPAGSAVSPRIVVNWGPADDPESGIQNYQYRVVPISGPEQVASQWVTVGPNVLTATIEGGVLSYVDSFQVEVKATNNAGRESGVTVVAAFRPIDPSAPSTPTAPVAAGVQHLARKVFLIITTRSNDSESGIIGYQYAVGTTPGGTNAKSWIYPVDFRATDLGPADSWMLPSLPLTPGGRYYVGLRGVNGQGMSGPACVSGPFVFDLTPPVKPTMTPSVATMQDGSRQLRLDFSNISDPESGISRIEYCIGTSTGTTNILQWQSVGTVSSTLVDLSGLNPIRAMTYYLGARTFNNAGMQSPEFWTSVQVPGRTRQ
ncbi:MAG: hypothetical protein Q8P51_02810 [Ignavibacteria bacterium]|nr:hypothetical protein [Ignavibacteria bacterium]